MTRALAAALPLLCAGCGSLPQPDAPQAEAPQADEAGPALSPAQGRAAWVSSRKQLDELRAKLVPPGARGYRVAATLHEGWGGRTFAARGAFAVRPPDALRMQLVGPAGALALDVWASGDKSRLATPALGSVERSEGAAPQPGRPTAFLRWWLLRPLAGQLLEAFVDGEGRARRFLLRSPDGALIDARVGEGGSLSVSRSTKADREHVESDGLACGTSTYESRAARLRVEIHCQGEAPPPSPRAFDDPDAPGGS